MMRFCPCIALRNGRAMQTVCSSLGDGDSQSPIRWQQVAEVPVNRQTLALLAAYCDALLVYGVDMVDK